MDIKQEHGLSYKVVAGADEFIDLSPVIRTMVKEYLSTAEDKYTVDDIMNVMSMAIPYKTMFVFVVEKDGVGVGLLTAHAISHQETERGAMVHIGYVDKHVSKVESFNIVETAMAKLFDWANDLKMTSIFAQTMRSEKPFDRLLMRSGWKRYTTVYEKEIIHVKPEEDSISGGGSPVATNRSGEPGIPT